MFNAKYATSCQTIVLVLVCAVCQLLRAEEFVQVRGQNCGTPKNVLQTSNSNQLVKTGQLPWQAIVLTCSFGGYACYNKS